MRNTYNENADSNFAKAYLSALQAIIRFDEELTGTRLNKTRNIMNSFASPEQVGGPLAERSIYIELRNLNIMERGVLYGDLKSYSRTPWIKNHEVLGMIGRHIRLLGNDEDKAQLDVFIKATEKSFGGKEPSISPLIPAPISA